ncbi:hypothetical protein [Paraburkholderia bryophila]|uniref:Uncharacterized protein n=1 Tax=Paraburkholderia bryophila TaxID=420952 RepID=A0A7Z0BB48_9BURK|nr:hypothetical protein [Paraburkholderia bryophila]NYH26062.1 hypothetical protein [Paraburkholderia bryophila]
MFDAPRANEFTQGTVFSCAYAENYQDESVYGLIITARCDAAQAKVSAFTYVPVIPLSSWIYVDGASTVLDRAEADYMNTISDRLEKDGLSESLLSTHSLAAIYDAHYKKIENEKARKSQCEKLRNVIAQVAETRTLQIDKTNRERLRAHLTVCKSHVDSVVKELAGHRLSGYYLLRGLEALDSGEAQDFVALLREVHHIPSSVAKSITNGISKDQWDVAQNKNVVCPKFTGTDDYALPMAKLTSPWIEHLMQNFALLFSRIGVRDNDVADVRKSLQTIGIGA